MDEQSKQQSPWWTKLSQQYSGPLTQVALLALSAWMIVTGLKGLVGLPIDQTSALADLLGVVLVISVLRWIGNRRRPPPDAQE